MRYLLLAVVLVLPLPAAAGTAAYMPGPSPQRVFAVTQSPGDHCSGHEHCVTGVDIPVNVPVELLVHDRGTIRKGIRAELVALGLNFEGEKLQARYLRALVTATCVELRELGMTKNCGAFRADVEARTLQ